MLLAVNGTLMRGLPVLATPLVRLVIAAKTALSDGPTVIVVQPVQHRARHHLVCVRLSGR